MTNKSACRHEKLPGEPVNYGFWHEWAKEMSKKYKQVKCEKCGLYKLWVKK